MLSVEFPLVQYIDLSERVHVLKAIAIVTSKHLNLSKIFVVNHFFSAKVSAEWRLNQGFGTQKNCPFPVNRGIPSTEVTKQRLYDHFSGTKFVSLNGGVPWIEVPQRRGSPVDINILIMLIQLYSLSRLQISLKTSKKMTRFFFHSRRTVWYVFYKGRTTLKFYICVCLNVFKRSPANRLFYRCSTLVIKR